MRGNLLNLCAEMSTCQKEKENNCFSIETSSTSNAVTKARSNIQMRQRIGQGKRTRTG